jgi:hypothetical protein
VEVTLDERRSAALFKHLLQEIASSCFTAQRGLLRSAEAVLKRTSASFAEQSAEEGDDRQAAAALEQDEAWAHDLVAEREDVLKKVLVEASVEHEKVLKRLEKEKKAKRRRNARYVSSGSDDSSDSESEEEDEEHDAVPARRELSSRRSKTAAVSRMHEKEGEFEAKIKQALQADDADEDEEGESESESESDEEESAEEGEEEEAGEEDEE